MQVISNNVTTNTLYFSDKYEESGTTKTRYVFAGNQRIAKVVGDGTNLTTVFYHKDHLGSTEVLTDVSGAVCNGSGAAISTARSSYLPFGLERDRDPAVTDSGESYRYTDQEKDASTGLYNYDARQYDHHGGHVRVAGQRDTGYV